MRPQGSPKLLEARRRLAWRLLKEGATPVEVAQRLGVPPRTVRRWRELGERGEEHLAARPVPGRPSKLSAVQRAELAITLEEGARSAGYADDKWSCTRVAELIRKRFGVEYHVDHVGRLLRGLGFGSRRAVRCSSVLDMTEVVGQALEA